MPNITTDHAIICLYCYPQKVCNFHMWVFQINLKYHGSKPIKLQKILMYKSSYPLPLIPLTVRASLNPVNDSHPAAMSFCGRELCFLTLFGIL